jgi:hypothetical protein
MPLRKGNSRVSIVLRERDKKILTNAAKYKNISVSQLLRGGIEGPINDLENVFCECTGPNDENNFQGYKCFLHQD